jgi:hypothetical protein
MEHIEAWFAAFMWFLALFMITHAAIVFLAGEITEARPLIGMMAMAIIFGGIGTYVLDKATSPYVMDPPPGVMMVIVGAVLGFVVACLRRMLT